MSHPQHLLVFASSAAPVAPASVAPVAVPPATPVGHPLRVAAPHVGVMPTTPFLAARSKPVPKVRAARPHRVRGVTLIEILVALVVIAFGMLGLGGLMATGVKVNHGAYLRSQAVNMAYDIADRMRANRAEALTGVYEIGLDEDTPDGTAAADQDLIAWRAALQRALPAGTGGIERINVGTGTVLQITIRWDNSRTPNETALETFVTRTDI